MYKKAADVRSPQPAAAAGEKQRRRRVDSGEVTAGVIEVREHGLHGGLTRRHHACLAALAADDQLGAVRAQVVQVQVDQFLATQAAPIEQLEDGTVAVAERSRSGLDGGQQPVYL